MGKQSKRKIMNEILKMVKILNSSIGQNTKTNLSGQNAKKKNEAVKTQKVKMVKMPKK